MLRRLITACAVVFLATSLYAQNTIIQIQNAGTTIGTFTKYLRLNCSTGTACTLSNGTVVLTATGAGTLSGNNTWTGTNIFSIPLTPSSISPAAIAAVDNSIQSSSVDANGAPSFITTAAATLNLPVNGGTTPLVMFIGGKQMTLATNVTVTLVTGVNYVYAIGDTTNAASLIAGDFIASTIPMSYSYAAPVCSNGSNTANGVGGNFAAASAGNPHYWFNMGTNQMNICTSSGGAFSATSYGGGNSPAILVGVAYSGGTNVDAIAPMPLAASPLRITRDFGSGADGALQITAGGTTTKDGPFQYTGLAVVTGTLTHTAINTNANTGGLVSFSQNPVIVYNGTITAVGLGRTAPGVGTGTGGNGNPGGIGGAGGGGGGSGTTSAAGGAGNGRQDPLLTVNLFVGGGTAGAITPTAGGTGGAATALGNGIWNRNPVNGCVGPSGGNGAGDGTNNGGLGGAGGGYVYIAAPLVSISGTGIVKSDGGSGSQGAGGNAGGGGGGGGGCAFVVTYMPLGITVGSTLTVNGGTHGALRGTGRDGGDGGAGLASIIRIQ